MTYSELKSRIIDIWQAIYPDAGNVLIEGLIKDIKEIKQNILASSNKEWYKDAVVYSLYVDLFNKDFKGLTEKLDYLQKLGINCIWLLPILESPMRDAGFDISDYRVIRADLLGLSENVSKNKKIQLFKNFIDEAHRKNIRVIFDIAINHTSDQHSWFIQARSGKSNPYRDYYIWSDTTEKYRKARIIFEGLCKSNWQKEGYEYYFHRFFEFQPDLNYRNPKVLIEMTNNFLFWLNQGVDGFRADAIPYLWKDDGTDCENLPQTHLIVKFFRSVLDYVKPDTLLLAEACQPPHEVVKYFGDGDECHAGYHFPLMPQIYKAIEMQNASPIRNILSPHITPPLPESAQWFTFLRCHDELSLELVYVSEEDRKYIHEHYCHRPEWDFRLGQGISARLSELMKRNPEKIALAFSIMLSLPGTPVLYYGDEFGKVNDKTYYQEQKMITGKNDTRYLVRGRIDWEKLESELLQNHSLASKVFSEVTKMLIVRKKYKAFGRGSLEFIPCITDEILGFYRIYKNEHLLILNNLSSKPVEINIPYTISIKKDLLDAQIDLKNQIPPYGYKWYVLDNE